jgi:lysozyme
MTATSASMPDYFSVFPLAKPLIKESEGYSSKPYLCPAGKWTIGWGTTRYPNGTKVQQGDYPNGIDPQWADLCLTSAMRRVADELRVLFKAIPTPAQYAAILSLAYNVGVGAHDGVKGDLADSTLLERFNAGDLAGAADEFPKWCKARVGGRLTVLTGLVARRAKERELFLA